MDQFDPQKFLNLGNLLVSDQYINSYTNKNNNCVITPINSYSKYKQEYMDKLKDQLTNFEKRKKELLKEYNSILITQKQLQNKILNWNKSISINKIYNNSATNFITLYNHRIQNKLRDTIQLYNDNNSKLDNWKKEIDFLDYCISKNMYYMTIYKL
jgi:hypothetical protein